MLLWLALSHRWHPSSRATPWVTANVNPVIELKAVHMKPMQRWHRRVGLVVLAVTTVAGCSSSGGSSGSAGASGAGETGSGQATAGASACVTEAKSVATKYEQQVHTQVPAPVNAKSLSSKTIWFISPDQAIDYVSHESKGVQQAAAAIGMKVKIFDGKSQPNLFTQGVETAVAQHAAGIIMNSIPPELATGALKKAVAAHIPVIDAFIGNDSPGTNLPQGIFAQVTNDYTQAGKIVADYVLAATGCHADALQFTASVYPTLLAMANGATAEFHRLCSACKISTVSVDPASTSTKVGPLVSAKIRRDPKINFLIAGFDDLITYAIPALRQSGNRSPIIGQAGNASNFDLIRSGGQQVADAAFPPGEYTGYLQVDELVRAMVGSTPVNDTIPLQLLTKQNVGHDNSLASVFPGLVGYQAAFAKAWGID